MNILIFDQNVSFFATVQVSWKEKEDTENGEIIRDLKESMTFYIIKTKVVDRNVWFLTGF